MKIFKLICLLSGLLMGLLGFSHEALSRSNSVELIEFYSPGCAACQRMAEVIASTSLPGVTVVKVNVASNPEEAQQYGVRAVPTIVVMGPHGQKEVVGDVDGSVLVEMVESVR